LTCPDPMSAGSQEGSRASRSLLVPQRPCSATPSCSTLAASASLSCPTRNSMSWEAPCLPD
jgi:hypothetical protein